MKTLVRHESPDGELVLVVVRGNDGQVAVGFDGGSWHTHPDLISTWLGVPEERAIDHFVEQVIADQLPVVISTDGGATIDPWVSDSLEQTIRAYGKQHLVLRYWSGNHSLEPDR